MTSPGESDAILARRPVMQRRAWLGLVGAGWLGAWLPAGARALSSGQAAPEIGLADVSGRMIRMQDLRGKVVLVDFWATWCGPCAEAMPMLERLQQRHAGQLQVVGVSQDRSADVIRQFVREVRVSFPLVLDAQHQVAARYAPPRMPTTYLVDRAGVVRHVHAGFRRSEAEAIEQRVARLVGASG